MFPRKIIQQIAAETKRYYAQCQQNVKNKHKKWVGVTEAELLPFLSNISHGTNQFLWNERLLIDFILYKCAMILLNL